MTFEEWVEAARWNEANSRWRNEWIARQDAQFAVNLATNKILAAYRARGVEVADAV